MTLKIPSPNLFWFVPRSTWTVASRLPGRTSKVQEPGNQLWLSLITDHDHFMLCPLYDYDHHGNHKKVPLDLNPATFISTKSLPCHENILMTWEFVFKRHLWSFVSSLSLYRDGNSDFKPVSVGKPHNVRRHFCKRSGPDRQDCETLVKRNTRPKCSNCVLSKSPHHKTLIIFS